MTLDFGSEVKRLLYFLANCSPEACAKDFKWVHETAKKLEKQTSTYIWADRDKIAVFEKIEAAMAAIEKPKATPNE